MIEKETEDFTIEFLRDSIKKWGPLLAVLGGAVGLFYEHKAGIERLSHAVVEIRKICDERSARDVSHWNFGPDGFVDPQIHAALDGHIRSFLRSYVSEFEKQHKLWEKRLCELNPSLKCPSE